MVPSLPTDPRLRRAYIALIGVAVGDAYGNHHGYNHRKHSAPIWEYSDDTQMALSIYTQLRRHGHVDQDELAHSFAQRREGKRGYGQGATRLLKAISDGGDWRSLSTSLFEGAGSYGNGAAMRIAPLGAYFADDMQTLIEQAELSSTVTHAHPEGIAGGIAVAVATAVAIDAHQQSLTTDAFVRTIIPHIPISDVRRKLEKALDLPADWSYQTVANKIGNGRPAIAPKTVPFAVWAAAKGLNDFESGIKQTASVGGDIDTNCAIVGGIMASYTSLDHIPADWLNRLEPLPTWPFNDEADHEPRN